MSFVIISSSLNPDSKSRILAKKAQEFFKEDVEFFDLKDYNLPICDGDSAYGNEDVIKITEKLKNAKGYLIATPVYNFDANSAIKNLIELTGKDIWTKKVVGFMCAAGGNSSYMSIMSLANSLMLDFRTFIIPRFVYATKEQIIPNIDSEVQDRIKNLVEELVRVTKAL